MWWCGRATKRLDLLRPGCKDSAFVGNIVEAMAAYGRGDLGEPEIPLSSVDRLIVIGSDGMMRAVQQARHTVLRPYLKPDHQAIGSINSPMQCMMKEICAQCLQMHKDPVTGKRDGGVLLLQSGPAARSRRVWQLALAAVAEWRAREADKAVGGSLLAQYRRTSRVGDSITDGSGLDDTSGLHYAAYVVNGDLYVGGGITFDSDQIGVVTGCDGAEIL